MIKDYFSIIKKYNLIDSKSNSKTEGYYYDKKIKNLLKEEYDIDLSDIRLTYAPLYPDGSLGELDWIYNRFEIGDFDNLPIKIAVISDEKLDSIKIGETELIKFITIPKKEFNEAFKKVIKIQKK